MLRGMVARSTLSIRMVPLSMSRSWRRVEMKELLPLVGGWAC